MFFAEFHSFRGTLGSAPSCANVATPDAKGLVERTSFETSFLPGRSFDSVAAFNTQFTGWLRRANQRIYAPLREDSLGLS